MPAFNLNNRVTKDQMIHANIDGAVHNSFNKTDTIQKNVSDILNIKEIKTAVAMLSKV